MCLLREVSLITVAFAWVVLAKNHKGLEETQRKLTQR